MLTILLLEWRAAFGMGARFAKILILGASAAVGTAHAQTSNPWQFSGGDIENSRARVSPAGPQQLNTVTAPQLTVKWTFNSVGAIPATPTVEQGGLYVTDWAGMLYKIDPDTGIAIWSHPISFYTGSTPGGVGSRSSPAIGSQGEIVVGDTDSATVFAVNRTTGALIWKTVVDSNHLALIHGSAVIYKGIVYVGVASGEEDAFKTSPNYVPSFRGSVVALGETTGNVLWKFYTVPPGYTGAALWNNQPVVFPAAHSLIIVTGNNYAIPASVAACVLSAGSDLASQNKCLDPADHVDSVVSLDLTTGKLNWSRMFQAADTFNGACEVGFSSCPNPEGMDADFVSAPNLVNVPNFTGVPDDRGGISNSYLLGAGQKTGMYWAINPYDGGLFGGTFVGKGEIKWGTAINTDNNSTALVAIDNGNNHIDNVLAGSPTVPPFHWNAGSWGSINLRTRNMTWQLSAFGTDLDNPAFGGAAPGEISFSNQVGFAGSSSGYVVAFDSSTGKILWSYNTGGKIESAPAIFNDTLYWGAGFRSTSVGKLYAFSIVSTASTVRTIPTGR
jgi:polyvinyl alcohol dehydrogenase (cytochrome)